MGRTKYTTLVHTGKVKHLPAFLAGEAQDETKRYTWLFWDFLKVRGIEPATGVGRGSCQPEIDGKFDFVIPSDFSVSIYIKIMPV